MSLLKNILNDIHEAANVVTGHPANYGMQPQDRAAAHGEAMGAAAGRAAAAFNGTKIPYKNGFYSGPYNPDYQNPDGMHQGLMKQLLSVVQPHVQQQTEDTPQSGFGIQVQDLGGIQPQIQAPRTAWQNTDQRLRDMVNPQVSDNGFYYY